MLIPLPGLLANWLENSSCKSCIDGISWTIWGVILLLMIVLCWAALDKLKGIPNRKRKEKSLVARYALFFVVVTCFWAAVGLFLVFLILFTVCSRIFWILVGIAAVLGFFWLIIWLVKLAFFNNRPTKVSKIVKNEVVQEENNKPLS